MKPRSPGLWFALLLAITLMLAWYFHFRYWAFGGPRISPHAAAEIRPGMTQADVVAIIGAPEGNYTGGPLALSRRGFTTFASMEGTHWRAEWTDDDGQIVVYFDDRDQVIGALYFEALWPSEPR